MNLLLSRLAYQPPANWNSARGGVDVLSVTLGDDAEGLVSPAFSLRVSPFNQSPTLTPVP